MIPQGRIRIISRLEIILFPLMPHRKDSHGLLVIDLKQGDIARAAKNDEQFAQEWAGRVTRITFTALLQLFDDAHRAQYAAPLVTRR
jgi:hypothetical protein